MTERMNKNTPSSWEMVSMAAVTMGTARLREAVAVMALWGIHPLQLLKDR